MADRGVSRRLTAWTMLVLHGLVASGLPLPLAVPAAAGSTAARALAAKDRSRPFPCMDTPCGCDSAERCFTACCCHAPTETLAWAQARGIEPAVIEALSRRVAEATPAPTAGSCCAESETSCCAQAGSGEADDAVGDERSLAAGVDRTAATDEQDDPPAGDTPPGRDVVTLRAMLACGGIAGGLLTATVGGDLPPPRVEFSPMVESRWEVSCRDERPITRPSEPAEPPPRAC